MYNDYWMLDNGFLDRQPTGDLRDLILRPYAHRDTVVVGPNELLVTAYNRMKLYDVSQLPVMEGDEIVGILDESDLLLHVYADEAKFRDPGFDRDGDHVASARREVADRGADAGVRCRACGDRGGRGEIPRADHAHRSAQLSAPARRLIRACNDPLALHCPDQWTFS